MSNCEYARDYYNVPACIGRGVIYDGKPGIITKDRGHYIGVTFDNQKPGTISNIHPADENLIYGEMRKIRKMTRGQARYREYIAGEFDCSFAEYIGIKQ